MNTKQKQMIAALVKEGRIAKGFTQKELAEISNISIRSIQRIENGDIIPRSYTLKALAGILGLPYEDFARVLKQGVVQETVDSGSGRPGSFGLNTSQRVIFSAGLTLVVVIAASAYLAQSARFPETGFELLVFVAFILIILTVMLALLWRKH